MKSQRPSGRSHGVPRHAAFELRPMMRFAGAPGLARRFGFTDRLMDDPDAMIPLPQWHSFIEAAAEARGDAYFGARFAVAASLTVVTKRSNGLALLALSSRSMGEALWHLVRYQHLFNEGDQYSLVTRGPHTHIRFVAWGPERLGQVHMAEKTVCQIAVILRLADPPIAPLSVHLTHEERPDSDEVLNAALGVRPFFASEHTEIVVRSADLARPIKGANPDFFHFFETYVRQRHGDPADVAPPRVPTATRVQPTSSHTLLDQVRAAISRVLHTGHNTREEVARQLDGSVRTLQRRLREEGTSLSDLITEVRQSRARALLENQMSLREVALLTGYANAPAFLRAFRRWYGMTPNEWRARSSDARPSGE